MVEVVKSFFWIEVFMSMCRVEETKNFPYEMTCDRDISQGLHNENG